MSESNARRGHGEPRRPAATPNESALLVNPLDPRHIVGIEETAGSEGMPVLAARVTFDGGESWRASANLTLMPGWAGVIGPVIAMDARGSLHAAALALDREGSRVCLAVYRSEDGGVHWSRPVAVLDRPAECSYSLAADLNAASAFRGNVYLAADAGGMLAFARSRDGLSWTVSDDRALAPDLCLDPEVLVDTGGGVHIVWMSGSYHRRILSQHSSDGGTSFGAPVMVADGIVDVCEWLPETVPATCMAPDGLTVCAWADYREGHSRIFYRRSTDGGRTWQGPSAGEPLEPGTPPDQHQFQPHLLLIPAGEICCAFYEYGPKAPGGDPLVNLMMAVSYNRGLSFTSRMELSEQPWNPAVDPPLSRGATKGVLASLFLD